SQFEVIPLGIDTEAVRGNTPIRVQFRNEIGATNGDIVVGFVGRLTEIKNLSHLLNVAAMYNKLSYSAKPSIKFVLVGEGHSRQSLHQEAESLGISNVLKFIGNRTDMTTVYSGVDVVALTSRNEGTPLSLIEAMGAGRPFISTTVGGVVDLLGAEHERL